MYPNSLNHSLAVNDKSTTEITKDLLNYNNHMIYQAETWNNPTSYHGDISKKETVPTRPMTKYLDTNKDSVNKNIKITKKNYKKKKKP